MSVTRNKKKPGARAIKPGVKRLVVGADRVATKRTAKAAAKPAAVATPAPTALTAAAKKPMKIADKVLQRARQMSHALERKKAPPTHDNTMTFAPYAPAPGVLPANTKPLAMDEAAGGNFGQLNSWAAGGELGGIGAMFEEGIGFLGYTYLAQLTQRPEYRRISERIATEMTRKWIKFNVVSKIDADAVKPIAKSDKEMAGNDKPAEPGTVAPGASPEDAGEGPEAAAATAEEAAQAEQERVRTSVAAKASALKAKRVKELTDEMSRLKVKDAFYNIAEGDGWFGRFHLFLDQKKVNVETPAGKVELKTSIGNGRNATSRAKVNKRNPITAVRCVEPMWCYPATYEASNPLKASFYTPSAWYANGIEIHGSRFLTFVGRELPDILKPAYAFGGLSMSQMAKPYVDNWLRTRQAVADLIESFSVSGVYTNMSATLQDGGDEALKRIELFNTMRSNSGAFALDKDTEEFFNVSTPLGTLDALQAQSQEQMSSVSGIPLIILLGITPQGLNASSEGEIRAFYDWINAYQESFFRDHLQTVIHFVMLSLWNEIDEEITFEFEPLWSMTDKEKAEVDKLEAETDQIRIDSGVLDPGEVRKAVAAQPDSRYADINPEDVPEPPEDPTAGGEDPFGGDDVGDGSDPEVDGADPTVAKDEGWNESDHDRAPDGKFGSGGSSSSSSKPASSQSRSSTRSSKGGSSSTGATEGKGRSSRAGAGASSSTASPAPLKVASLKKQGGKLGSNEGGVYTDDAGGKFYVKKPSSQAHVANEMAASRLYQLAGVNTLNYRDAGPDHVATEWQQLDKNNISKFTPAEKKAAAADFAVHAWLSNWDAAGLGGDNQGIMGGKATTLDVGGSLRYRAQGGPKGGAFGNKVTEIDTLRDKSMNPDAAGLFGSMSDAEIKTSIERVTSIPDDKIRAAVGDDKALADTLIARKADMAKRFGIAMDSWLHPVTVHTTAGFIAQDEATLLAALDAAAEDDEELEGDAAMMAAALDAADDDQDEDAGEPTEVAPDVFAMDEGQFDESLHPRSADGKFGSGGGGAKQDGKSSAVAGVFKTKKEHIAHLLTEGTTPKALMQAMGWPSVSMPAQAKSLGMKLSIETVGGQKVYKGTWMTPDELKAAKAEDKGKLTDKAAQQILKNAALSSKTTPETLLGSTAGQVKPPKAADIPFSDGSKPSDAGEPPKNYGQFIFQMGEAAKIKDVDTVAGLVKYNPTWAKQFLSNASPEGKAAFEKIVPGVFDAHTPKAPQATADELKKAAKSTTLPISTTAPAAVLVIKDFNDKYAGKDNLTPEQLHQKVQDFKDLKAVIPKLESEYENASKAEKAAANKKALEDAKKKEADKLAKEKAELQAEFDKDPDLQIHYEAAEAMFGGKDVGAQYIAQAASKVKSAGLSKYMTGADAMPIIAYSGSHYTSVNKQLRAGKMTEAQDKFRQSLNAGLDKLPSYNATTYRKASLDAQQSALYEVGYVVEERGFTSSSKNQGTWSGDHDFTIHGKNGKDIQKLSSHQSEAEVLFKSGSRFKVLARQGNHITMQEV